MIQHHLWREVIEDITWKHAFSHKEIACRMEVDEATVRRWASQKETPSFQYRYGLLQLLMNGYVNTQNPALVQGGHRGVIMKKIFINNELQESLQG